MPRQAVERKRRIPRQARAGSTVDAILEATLQLLETHGADQLTTNHIAQRAGVSIGTIYQYFRNKKAILAALAERRADTVRDNIADLIIRDPGAHTIRPIIRALAKSFQGSLGAREALSDVAGAKALSQHHEAFLAAIEGRARLSIELTPERAFILTHTPISLLRAAAITPELGLDPQVLEDELVRLMEGYLWTVAATPKPA